MMHQKVDQDHPQVLKIAVLPGDGIGEEVMAVALPVLEELGIHACLEFGDIGWECWKREGTPVPDATWDLINRSNAVLLGAITSKPLKEAELELPPHLQGKGIQYISPVIQLRQRLSLFANVRPVQNWTNAQKPFRFAVIRENTEGLYAGLDFQEVPSDFRREILRKRPPHSDWGPEDLEDATCSIRLMTRRGLARLFKFSFEYARENGYSKVTFADKPNVLRLSGHFSKTVLEEIARDYPDIKFDIQNADAVALRMVVRPEDYGVIVSENMFGDLLSDLGAGVMGGLGLAPSANLGMQNSYFEPVHGSAPKYAGLNKANPIAMFLTIALMLKHTQFIQEADRIETAVRALLKERKVLPFDLGGTASTRQVADRVLQLVSVNQCPRAVSILSVGSELVQGEVINSVGQQIAKQLSDEGIQVLSHATVTDSELEIKGAVGHLLSHSDALIVTGGLGPTSDDRTRFAIGSYLGKKLIFDETTWDRVCARLEGFGLAVHESNRQQALFPEGAVILPNTRGTAAGCAVHDGHQTIFMLPGPPRESMPLFREQVLPLLREMKYPNGSYFYKWILLGAVEGDLAAQVDEVTAPYGREIETGYRWSYPYLEVKIKIPASFEPSKTSDLFSSVRSHLAPYLVTEGTGDLKVASKLLSEYLSKRIISIFIDDQATKGTLSSLLLSPELQSLLCFSHSEGKEDIRVRVAGLDRYWKGAGFTDTDSLKVDLTWKNQTEKQIVGQFPLRGHEVRNYASEFASFQILKFLKEAYHHD